MEPESSLPCSRNPPLGTNLRQMDPAYILQPYFFEVLFNIIFQSAPSGLIT
jgi:hypothetical protein